MLDYAWDLASIPGLKPGDAVEFQLACSDDQPQYGRTAPIRLNIVSGDDILSRIDRRQASIAERLRAGLAAQRTARGLSQALEIQLRETGKLSREDLDALQNAEFSQRRVGQTLENPQEGAAPLIASVLEELQSNRIDNPQVVERLTRLRDAVGRLTTEWLPKIQFELTQALKAARETLAAAPPPVKDAATPSPPVDVSPLSVQSITAAGQDQEEVTRRLEEMLATLSQWESTHGSRRIWQAFAANKIGSRPRRRLCPRRAKTWPPSHLSSGPTSSD